MTRPIDIANELFYIEAMRKREDARDKTGYKNGLGMPMGRGTGRKSDPDEGEEDDGPKKDYLFHGGAKAAKAADADSWTQRAEQKTRVVESGKQKNMTAGAAHQKAADMHEKASNVHDAQGRPNAAEYHSNMARYHNAMMASEHPLPGLETREGKLADAAKYKKAADKANKAAVASGEWDESKHPRDAGGKFA